MKKVGANFSMKKGGDFGSVGIDSSPILTSSKVDHVYIHLVS